MHIRVATINDLSSIIDCIHKAYSKYIPRIGREPAPMLADYKTQLEQNIVWVLTDHDEVRGLLVAFPEKDYYFIENVAVHPDFQGRGYGEALMHFAEEKARALQLSELRLYTNAAMTENLVFYPKLGFEETERKTESGYQRVYFRRRLE
jgi:N-acetylglutamate synthase-like GNAT family acetyltransferase